MDPDEAYEKGSTLLKEAWSEVRAGAAEPHLPMEINTAIVQAMAPGSQVSQRYALPTQVLLTMVVSDADVRRLQEFVSVDGAFSARSFARETVVQLQEVGRRLGASDDPYVSNPLRTSRLADDLQGGRGGPTWAAVFKVLDFVQHDPEQAKAVLLRTLIEVKDRPEAVLQGKAPSPKPKSQDLTSLSNITNFDQDFLLDIIEVLESDQPQVIFAGPPGTSKTYVAVALAEFLTGGDEDRYRVIQLHASYGYEEFIEGVMPVATGGMVSFEVMPGVVRRFAEGMGEHDRKVLVLDEINRANLPRVFGELLYAIERREESVDLLYTEGFRLPAGVVFIGTMNTADRSIRSIDAAIRRRFQVFDFPPRPKLLETFYGTHNNEVDDLVTGFEALNATLTTTLDRYHTIGHTFFMDARGMTAARLHQVWDRQVLPLIEEYLFDQPDLVTAIQFEQFWPSAAAG